MSSSTWLSQIHEIANVESKDSEEQETLSNLSSQLQERIINSTGYTTIICNNYNAVSNTNPFSIDTITGSKKDLVSSGGYMTYEINIPAELQNSQLRDLEVTRDDCEIFYIVPHHKCNICDELFNIVDQLSDHIYTVHLRKPPHKDQCLICGELFDIISITSMTSLTTLLDQHMSTVHPGNNPYRCKYCARRFPTRNHLLNHNKYLHYGLLKPYECDLCGRSYSVLSDLQNHKAEQHKKLLNCPYCTKCFDKNNDFKFHLRVHINPEKTIDLILPNYDSITLEDSYTGNNIKLEEYQQSNSKLSSHNCFICGSFVEDILSLNEHLQIHSNDAVFECPDCHGIYREYIELMEHMNEHINLKLKITNKSMQNMNNQGIAYVQKIHCGCITRPSTPVTVENQKQNEGNDDENEFGESNNTENITVPCGNRISPSTLSLSKSEKLCILCKQVFRNTEKYDNHIKSHSRSMILRNTGPLGTVSWKNKLLKSYPHRCKLCKRYFVLGTTLLLHNKIVHKELKPYKCEICLMSFAQSSELLKHYKMHPGIKKFSCKLCDLKFSEKRNLRNHKNHHKGNQYKCTYCGSDCSNEIGLQKHKIKHIGETTKECAFCEVPFGNDADLNIHVSRVHNVNPEIWQCRICHTTCKSADEIMRHNRINHAGEKPYKCDQCDKSFALLHSLVNHKVVHSGKKDYKCKYCNKKFSYASYLKMHIKIHTGERPYVCPNCPKTFAREANLYEHKKQHVYDTPKPYTCEVCGKRYVTLSTFNKHKLLHTGIKSFKCSKCSKAYVQKSQLDRHMYLHSNIRAFKCEVCGKKFKSPCILARHERHIHCIFRSKRKIQEMIKNTEILLANNENNSQSNKIQTEEDNVDDEEEEDDDDFYCDEDEDDGDEENEDDQSEFEDDDYEIFKIDNENVENEVEEAALRYLIE